MHVHVSNSLRRCTKILNISLFTGLMFVFTGCHINDDDDDDFIDPTNVNTNVMLTGTTPVRNSNSKVVNCGSIIAVTESNTNITEVASRLEIPRLKGGQNLFIVHTVPTYGVNYCVEWNYALKAQRWSAFRWDNTNSGGYTGRTDAWSEDPLIPTQYRTTLADHQSNGHDRGHMLASSDRQNSVAANEQTFYMSNMHPQLSGFNSNDSKSNWWNLEIKLNNVYKNSNFRDTLYVVKGGTIDNNNYYWAQGRGQRLPAPKYFFMALLRKKNNLKTNGGYDAIGFWMEHKTNADKNLKNYAVSIDELERKTDIDFFCNLPDKIEDVVEAKADYSVWRLN